MRRLATATALVFVGAAAFAQDVKTDFDKDANFSAVKTFSVKIGTSWNNQISEKRISDEMAQTLTEKGWKQVDANPDALVLLHGATEKQKSLNTFYSGGGYGGYGYRGWGGIGGMGTATTTTSEFTVATLVVDIFDAKSKALMFRGTATDEISDKAEKNKKKLDKASSKMFKDFPRAPRRTSRRNGGRQTNDVGTYRRGRRQPPRGSTLLAAVQPRSTSARPRSRAPANGRRPSVERSRACSPYVVTPSGAKAVKTESEERLAGPLALVLLRGDRHGRTGIWRPVDGDRDVRRRQPHGAHRAERIGRAWR